jgi:hypothetical protein
MLFFQENCGVIPSWGVRSQKATADMNGFPQIIVMPGLVPAIHVFLPWDAKGVDARTRPGMTGVAIRALTMDWNGGVDYCSS